MQVKILDRTGKDFIEFTKRSMIDQTAAIHWAMSKFITLDGELLELEMIANLHDKAYLILSSKVFPIANLSESLGIYSDDGYIYFPNDIKVREKKIHRDILMELQTSTQDNKNATDSILNIIPKFYDVSKEQLLDYPYYVLSFLMEKINFFLSEITEPNDSFDIEQVWIHNPEQTADGKLG